MNIKTKLISSFGIVVFIALVLVAFPIILRQINVQQSDLEDEANYMQQIVYAEVENFLAEPKSMLDSMVEYARTQELDREVITPWLAGLASKNSDYQYIYYVDAIPYKDGGFLADNLHLDIPDDYDQTTRGWFQAAAKTDGYIVTEPYMDIMVGGVVITIAERVYKDGRFFGVAAVDIALDKVVSFANNFTMTNGGQTYILNKDGLYITNSDKNKVLNQNANFFRENNLDKYKSAITSKEGYVTLNAGNKNYLIASLLPEVTGWIFVSTGPRSELLGSVYSNLRFALIITVVMIIAALVTAILISDRIVKPISEVVGAVRKIAEGNADLTFRLQTKTHDEIGNLVKGFNAFMEKLQSIIGVMKQSKDILISAGNELQASTENTVDRTREIISSVDEMTGSVDIQNDSVHQTAGAVNEILANISSLENMVQSQSAGVQQASSAVEQMIGNISSVNASVDKMAHSFQNIDRDAQTGAETQTRLGEQINKIEEQSKLLQDANTTIASIASQTNLLAMNAAIEAAHAGEAGKGFAVVADEIRKLSETSTAQSKTIGTQLKDIQETINTVVIAAQDGVKGYTVLSNEIRETDELVRMIKSAMEEQNEGSKQIIESLHGMNDSTLEVRNASKEMAEGSKAILQEVRALQDATANMKDGIQKMSSQAGKITETSEALTSISERMSSSITDIGNQVDQFEV